MQRVLTVRAGSSICTRTKTCQTYSLNTLHTKRKSQEGYTLTNFIYGFLFGRCLLAHPLSTVWIIQVHFLGVCHPVACFPRALFGVVGQV